MILGSSTSGFVASLTLRLKDFCGLAKSGLNSELYGCKVGGSDSFFIILGESVSALFLFGSYF